MPIQKDFKRLVRSRMKKTGEAYTAARLQLLNKRESPVDYAKLAGMSDASVSKQTDARGPSGSTCSTASRQPRQTAPRDREDRLVARNARWWSQMVTVGYERIRGLREKGQRRGGGYEASKSRTYRVPVATLFDAFASARRRNRWLPVKVTVRSSAPHKRMRIEWDDKTIVQVGFLDKGKSKSAVAIQHREAGQQRGAAAMKKAWAEHFDRLGQMLG